jgi:hypothetical protein
MEFSILRHSHQNFISLAFQPLNVMRREEKSIEKGEKRK